MKLKLTALLLVIANLSIGQATLQETYATSISANELKEKYEEEYGESTRIKDLNSGILSLYLNNIVRDLPQYKNDLEEMIEAIVLENRIKNRG